MRKLTSVALDNRPKYRRGRLIAFVILPIALMLSPIVYESGVLCVAGWRGLFGAYPHTHTPVLDAISELYATASYDGKTWFRGIFNRTPWKSSFVIPFAIFWTGILALLLRKC